MVSNAAQHLAAIAHQAQQFNTGSTHVARTVKLQLRSMLNDTGINAQLGQGFRIQNLLLR